MELSPSCEATSCAATQEIPNILWDPKVHYHVHKSPPLVPTLNISIQSILPPPIFLRSILRLSTHLRLGLPSGLFPSGFPTNFLYAFLFYPIQIRPCFIVHLYNVIIFLLCFMNMFWLCIT
jgi:hypothetical protein